MFGVNAPVSARVPRVTDAFPQSHNSPPDSCMVLPHFPSNPVLVAVISCSSTAQTVFNTQKNTFISKPQSTFWLYLSRPSKNKRYLQDKYIFCTVSYVAAVSAVFPADYKMTTYNSLVSCLMGDQVHLWTYPYQNSGDGKCILLLPLPRAVQTSPWHSQVEDSQRY